MPARNASIPQFATYIKPILDALRELGGSGRREEVATLIAEKFVVSEDAQNELTKGGIATRFSKDLDWARFYLAKGGYLDKSPRGVWALTEKGLKDQFSAEDAAKLFKEVHGRFAPPKKNGRLSKHTPRMRKRTIDSQINFDIDHQSHLISILRRLPPDGFERLCQRLLRESGFEQVTVTGRTGDGGLDGVGILQVNPFVSFRVLFQCKRYSKAVSPSQVRDFRGAMMGRADKGIILTTGTFTQSAQQEALRDGVTPIELVDGEKLMDMFEQLGLGLRPRKAYEVDSAFFNEFE